MSLESEIRNARSMLENQAERPENEACTCDWVIMPLLLEAGYGRKDIISQASDPQGRMPDYVVLPKTEHQWFLEAKAWDVSLQDRHAIQAISYAHTAGSRWVVLTNGRDWRLYDDHLVGVEAAARMVARARLEVPGQIESFMQAISREAIMSKRTEHFARTSSLSIIVGNELSDPSSKLIASMVHSLRKSYRSLSRLSPDELVAELSGLQVSEHKLTMPRQTSRSSRSVHETGIEKSKRNRDNAPFWQHITEPSTTVFKKLLGFLEEQDLTINWGSAGFSAGFNSGRKRHVILYARPGGSKKIGDRLLFFAGKSGCWESGLSAKTVDELADLAMKTGLFEPRRKSGALICRIDSVRTARDFSLLTTWIARCSMAIRKAHGA